VVIPKHPSLDIIKQLFDQPFNDLLWQAQQVHRAHFDPNKIQFSRLISIKTGSCPEDCKYCSQSGHYKTGITKEKLMPLEQVVATAKQSQANGATRFCMGAAWRSPPVKEMPKLLAMIKSVKALGLETCVTLGMLDKQQSQQLANAGLDYYNHNIDTSPEYYQQIISTRCFADRLATLDNVRASGIKVCCGGILGMGESRADRVSFLHQLANLAEPPESVPINKLMPIPGTPLADAKPIDDFELIRTIAVARLLMPKSYIRLSAGRISMNQQAQAWCFFAGANSIFYDGEKLLTAANPGIDEDQALFTELGLEAEAGSGLIESEQAISLA
jgi:biotin synthase